MKISNLITNNPSTYVSPYCETLTFMTDKTIMSVSGQLPNYSVSEEEEW